MYLDSVEYADGMVVNPGTGTYFSTIDTSKIKLLTGYGDNYTMPRFFYQALVIQVCFYLFMIILTLALLSPLH
ncbi:MAG: hypothetical protein CM15mP106_2220 [Candidatus Neomarinimicrobiota bacterium]|nr:MAG: hypothetical protein CM15mP106_2220 [Candidatus Neomarinimicrobiota bacterium]